ncbi:hypothetical protein [Dysgonomonas sp. ZJ279]|uniref:hypothetical protein n=1 Tax=Dysgonomonas sp. ZJ279 TaxID=2709796 RepID=UPI0021062662|nr:hypothetical protein [Dysgonomonas sp. ZJ279]
MKKIRLLFAISLFSTSIFSQWNNNGDNSTTGTLKISSLSSNSSNVNTIEIRSHASNESYQGINFNFDNLLKSYIISQITPQNGRVDLKFRTMNSAGIASQMIYTGDSDLGIGTTPKSKLDVNGTIRSKEVKIEATGWSDFVFDKDYMLPTLSEVESHINEYKTPPRHSIRKRSNRKWN